MNHIEHLTMKVQDAIAAGTTGGMSTGEALAVAMVLNRSDWLADMGYTIADALNRVDDDWVQAIPTVARITAKTNAVIMKAQSTAGKALALDSLIKGDSEVDLNAKLTTYGNAPGYRSVSLTFDVERVGSSNKSYCINLNLNAEDSISILKHVLDVNRFAWSSDGPIDKKEGEKRPLWIDRL